MNGLVLSQTLRKIWQLLLCLGVLEIQFVAHAGNLLHVDSDGPLLIVVFFLQSVLLGQLNVVDVGWLRSHNLYLLLRDSALHLQTQEGENALALLQVQRLPVVRGLLGLRVALFQNPWRLVGFPLTEERISLEGGRLPVLVLLFDLVNDVLELLA